MEFLVFCPKAAMHCRLTESFFVTSLHQPELTLEVVIQWACLQQMFCPHATGLTGAEFWLTCSKLGEEVVVHRIVDCVQPEGGGIFQFGFLE